MGTSLLRFSTLLLISSLIACCSNIDRPAANLKYVNGPGRTLEGYNTLIDYDDNGIRKPDAVKRFWPLTTMVDAQGVVWIKAQELNAWLCLDPQSQEELKSYIGRARDAYSSCQKPKK